MPGKGALAPVVENSPTSNISLLKAHKVLPKKRISVTGPGPAQTTIKVVKRSGVELQGYSSSERIHSWIPSPSNAHEVPDNVLPLTPPSNSTEDVNRVRSDDRPTKAHARTSSHTTSSGLTTPVVRRSPPTPETTPPKVVQTTLDFLDSSTSHLPSTRAESFETARENISSDDEETHRLDSPLLNVSRQKWLKHAHHSGLKEIGLGLGLESEDGEGTPTAMAPKYSLKDDALISFDGAWNDATPELDAVKGGADLSYRSELKKRHRKRPRISDQLLETPLVDASSVHTPPSRSLSLRERVDQSREALTHSSTEDFAEQVNWPLKEDGFNIDEALREVDNRRLSQMSGTSAVVEAMVFNTPPQRRRTLRHSAKFDDLTSATTQEKRRTLNLDDHGHRRLLRHSKYPNVSAREPSVSDARGGGDPRSSGKGYDVIPVIVISSLQPSSPRPRPLRRMKPLTDLKLQSLRPTTAPEDAVGYFDLPRHERRTISAYIQNTPLQPEKRIIREAPPSNLSATSPPSAPATREISRTTSHTSNGIDSISPPTRQLSELGLPSTGIPDTGRTSPDQESNGGWSGLRPRSSLVTPFSLRSARSSTPGTLEVNEATAISIYPHTNKSILVVQHAPRRDSQAGESSAIIAANARFAIPAGSAQQPVIHQPRELTDSPLQNPRSPPQPPDFKIIPPTPANATDVSSLDRTNANTETPKGRFSAPLSRVRRALSARRYSDNFVAPFARTLSRRSDTARRASTGIDPNRNLHPLWRPRAFWDDNQSDSDSEFGNDGVLQGNSLGLTADDGCKSFEAPKRRASLSQRLSSLRSSRRRSDIYAPDSVENNTMIRPISASKRRSRRFSWGLDGSNDSYEFQPVEDEERGVGGVPRLGYQVQFVGFKTLAGRVKERREEARREKVREKLRGSVHVLRGV